MEMILRTALAVTVMAGLAACAPTTDAVGSGGGSGPQFAADDPCQGVVPQLCAVPRPVVNGLPGEQPF